MHSINKTLGLFVPNYHSKFSPAGYINDTGAGTLTTVGPSLRLGAIPVQLAVRQMYIAPCLAASLAADACRRVDRWL